MEVFTVLTDPILPVFAIMALGFVLGRTGRFRPEEARTLNRFVMSVPLPLLLFDLVAHAPVHDFSLGPILIYALAQLVLFSLGFAVARMLGREPMEAALLSFGAIFPNTLMYVLPISVLIFGKEAVLPVTTVVTWDSTVTFALIMVALQLMERGRVAVSEIVAAFLRTPMLMAIVVGVVIAVARIEIPAPVQTFLSFNSAAAPPVALFALGVIMSETRFRPNATVGTFVLIKLIAFPLFLWLGLSAIGPVASEDRLYVLAAAGPAGAMSFTLAVLHGVRTDAIAQVLVWTSVLTLFTLAWIA